jgi:polygalacturonase
MTRRTFARAFSSLALCRCVRSQPAFDVRAHGAKGDGVHLDTAAIQSAVDACAAAGGGAVLFAPGTYRSGTIRLRDRVRLHLASGATLLASTDLADYPVFVPKLRSFTDTYTDKSLIYAEGVTGAGLEGEGAIDGQGASFSGPYKVRPYLIRFIECREIAVRDLELRNSPMWVQHYLACEGVRISGLRVHSRVNRNNDGIDIDSSSDVRISDCHIVSGDDAIVLKATTTRPCRDVVVANCVLSSLCNALKLGTESTGGFDNIAISNCAVYDTNLAGIALEAVDGGSLERVTVSNVVMRNVACPIFIRLGDRGRPYTEGAAKPPAGALRNVLIEGIEAGGANRTGCPIAGIPDHPIENLTLRDISLSFAGGGATPAPGQVVPEQAAGYPEYRMFGALPAYGFYARHVRGLRLDNVTCTAAAADSRPAFLADDVEQLTVSGLTGNPTSTALVELNDVRDADLRGLTAPAGPLLELAGARTARIEAACPQDRVRKAER